MHEATVASWGNVNPVQFVKAVTPQMANDLAEMGRKLRTMQDRMDQLSGGDDGRDFTQAETVVWDRLRRATREAGEALIAANKVLAESVALRPIHDGGPDIADGAPSDGHVSEGVLV